jgi:hypothetical protein
VHIWTVDVEEEFMVSRLAPLPVLAAAALTAALTTGAVTAAAPAASAGLLAPANCAQVKAQHPAAADGEFTIQLAGLLGALIPVYCADLAGSPAEYLSLPRTGSGVNFAQYTAGGASPGTNVVTQYRKLRFDPVPVSLIPLRFRVNIADQRFATSTGQLCHSSSASPCPAGQLVTSMPYGVAFDCLGAGSTAGVANLDLTGTLFGVVDTFVSRTFPPGPGGGATFVNPQVVNVTGGGFCGWTAPADLFNPSNTNAGWDLRLNLLGL